VFLFTRVCSDAVLEGLLGEQRSGEQRDRAVMPEVVASAEEGTKMRVKWREKAT
jgi:hypothetical protein